MKPEITVKDIERVSRLLRRARKLDELRTGGCVATRDGRLLRLYSIGLREDELDELEAVVKLARKLLKFKQIMEEMRP